MLTLLYLLTMCLLFLYIIPVGSVLLSLNKCIKLNGLQLVYYILPFPFLFHCMYFLTIIYSCRQVEK